MANENQKIVFKLVKGGVVQTSHTKDLFLTNTFQKYFVGGSIDLWNNTFTKSDIENSGFGVLLNPVVLSFSSGQNVAIPDDLLCTNYDFDLGTDPSIKGISIEIEARWRESVGNKFIDVRYVKIWVHTLEGEGTTAEPYLIKNWWHLDMIRDDLDAEYKLVNNLDKDTDGYDDVGDDWTPIHNFNGVFDGDGHTISGLVVDISGSHNNTGGGLFGDTGGTEDSCEIKNLGLVNVDINCTTSSSSTFVGSAPFIGVNNGTLTIENCFVRGGSVNIDGSVDFGSAVAGGLVGWDRGTLTINKCYSVLDSITASNTGEFNIAIVGGILMGSSAGTNTFWNTTTSGVTTSDGGTGKTTAEMKDIDTYTDTDTTGLDEAWDMVATADHDDETWFLGSDMGFELYPQLKGERKFLYGDALVEDFESGAYDDGDPITWTETNGSLTVSDTTPINGTYSIRETSPANDLRSLEYDTDIDITDDIILGCSLKGTSGSGFWGIRIEYVFDDDSVVNFWFATANRDGYLLGTFYNFTNTVNDFTRIEFHNSGDNIRAEAYSREGVLLDVSAWKERTSNKVVKVRITRTQPNAPPSGTYYIDDVVYGYTDPVTGVFVKVKLAGSFEEKPLMIKKDGTFEQASGIQGGGWS